MVQLGSEQLLEIVLAVAAAGIGAVAAVFALVVTSTRRTRGRGWTWGWTFFALTLALDALAQHAPLLAAPLHYLATTSVVLCAYYTGAVAFDLCRRPMAGWAYALLACATAGGYALTSYGPLLATELILLAAMVIFAASLAPFARDAERFGARAACVFAGLVGLFLLRTLIAAGILAAQGRRLTAVYWTWELVFGGILAFLLALSELVALLDELRLEVESAAKLDPLTRLYNRNAFYSVVRELAQAGRLSGSIAILDLNDLKKINDGYGHEAGDRALLGVAKRLSGMARAGEYVFRWGGDEFVMLLGGMTAEAARDRLRHMRPPQPLDLDGGGRIDLELSWGICSLGEDVDAALRDADRQLYEHKRMFVRVRGQVPAP